MCTKNCIWCKYNVKMGGERWVGWKKPLNVIIIYQLIEAWLMMSRFLSSEKKTNNKNLIVWWLWAVMNAPLYSIAASLVALCENDFYYTRIHCSFSQWLLDEYKSWFVDFHKVNIYFSIFDVYICISTHLWPMVWDWSHFSSACWRIFHIETTSCLNTHWKS